MSLMNRQNIETSIGIPLPKNFESENESIQKNIVKYLEHLNPIEKKAYAIGYKHLGTSFNLLKSNGYNNWIKNNK